MTSRWSELPSWTGLLNQLADLLESSGRDAMVQPALIEQVILIRGHRVMLDRDLAALYGVETKNLNKAVRRNPDRFSARLYVSTYNGRSGGLCPFKVPIWNLEEGTEHQVFAAGLHAITFKIIKGNTLQTAAIFG